MNFGLPVVDHQALPVMTVEMAHAVMQNHIGCLVNVCPRKRQAHARLVEARRLVPADAPHMGS
jgi:hypothetical protein